MQKDGSSSEDCMELSYQKRFFPFPGGIKNRRKVF